ncbi:hypothetical protein GOP47_0023931 [Adiantum capillus-veneris]|uniref:Uncharacterized protein n=1 Tax=Adiantum capillus-veneris TaxID=13818 RepID=A0A9D4U6Y8_ADICA|nr:hypothetical protein GOP47_0023930 [Adiantum capillus-veneris]KAI5061426.1 hypothetical protein GOP47_0023931 [Adiantum capillus-veneris]
MTPLHSGNKNQDLDSMPYTRGGNFLTSFPHIDELVMHTKPLKSTTFISNKEKERKNSRYSLSYSEYVATCSHK